MMIRHENHSEDLLRDFEDHLLEAYLDEIVNGTKVVLRQSNGRNTRARPKLKECWGGVTCDIVRKKPS